MTDILGPASADHATNTRPADGRTFGANDTWFQPCSTSTSNDGTEIDADWLNGLLASLRGLYRANGNTISGPPVVAEDNADAAIKNAVLHLIQRGQQNFAVATMGSANAYSITLSPAPAELKAGMRVWVAIPTANTGASTLAINGTTKTIVGLDGAAMAAGDLPASIVGLVYDGTNLVLENGRYAGLVHYGIDGGTANTLTVSTWSPAMPITPAGTVALVKVNASNLAASTLNGVAIKRVTGAALEAGDLVAGGMAILINDGTNWQLANPSATPAASGTFSYNAMAKYYVSQAQNGKFIIGNSASAMAISTDGGATASVITDPFAALSTFSRCIGISADGQNIVLGAHPYSIVAGGKIAVSTNGGSSFTMRTTPAGLTYLATAQSMSEAGAIVAVYSSNIYLSTDHGVTWSTIGAGVATYLTAAISGDGTRIIAGGALTGNIYVFNNSGTLLNTISTGYNFVAVLGANTNGTRFAATAINTFGGAVKFFISLDGSSISEADWSQSMSLNSLPLSGGVGADGTFTAYGSIVGAMSSPDGVIWTGVPPITYDDNGALVSTASYGAGTPSYANTVTGVDRSNGSLIISNVTFNS